MKTERIIIIMKRKKMYNNNNLISSRAAADSRSIATRQTLNANNGCHLVDNKWYWAMNNVHVMIANDGIWSAIQLNEKFTENSKKNSPTDTKFYSTINPASSCVHLHLFSLYIPSHIYIHRERIKLMLQRFFHCYNVRKMIFF